MIAYPDIVNGGFEQTYAIMTSFFSFFNYLKSYVQTPSNMHNKKLIIAIFFLSK